MSIRILPAGDGLVSRVVMRHVGLNAPAAGESPVDQPSRHTGKWIRDSFFPGKGQGGKCNLMKFKPLFSLPKSSWVKQENDSRMCGILDDGLAPDAIRLSGAEGGCFITLRGAVRILTFDVENPSWHFPVVDASFRACHKSPTCAGLRPRFRLRSGLNSLRFFSEPWMRFITGWMTRR